MKLKKEAWKRKLAFKTRKVRRYILQNKHHIHKSRQVSQPGEWQTLKNKTKCELLCPFFTYRTDKDTCIFSTNPLSAGLAVITEIRAIQKTD